MKAGLNSRSSFARIYVILLTLLGLAWGVKSIQFWHSRQVISQVHAHEFVLIGDSHADDIPWPQRPRFTTSAQDPYTSYKYLEAIAQTAEDDSKLHTVVLSIWPSKFAPQALRRFSGQPQHDRWDIQSLGKLAPLLQVNDLWDSLAPRLLRWRALLHTFQIRRVYMRFDQDCTQQSVPKDFKRGQVEDFMHTHWWPDSEPIQRLYRRCAELVVEQNWQLILVENPLEDSYLRQIHPESYANYRLFLENLRTAFPDHVQTLELGKSHHPHSFFRDWHHLTCEGEQYVSSALDPLLFPESP